MICTNCEDSGYEWETVDACGKCKKGTGVQHKQNQEHLKWHNKEVRRLRKEIKEYQRNIKLP